jgi:hypothetical protein
VTLVARHVLCFGHITADSEHLPAEFFNHPGRFLVALVGHVGKTTRAASRANASAAAPADAASGAGDEGNLACEAPI